jgi:hypothetical protein
VQHTGQTGQTGHSQKGPKHQTGLPTSKLTQTRNSCNTGLQRTHPNVHPSKNPIGVAPVRPVRGTGQTGVTGLFGMNSTRGSTPPNPSFDLPSRSTNVNKTLGIVGTPHQESIATINPTKPCPNKRNRGNPAKNTSNPRTRKTPKSSPLTHGFGRGITAQRTTKGSHKFPPSNP